MRSSTWYGGAEMRTSTWATISWAVAGLMLLVFGLAFGSGQPVGAPMTRGPQVTEPASLPSVPASVEPAPASGAPTAPPPAGVLRLSKAVQQLDADVQALREAVVRLPRRGR